MKSNFKLHYALLLSFVRSLDSPCLGFGTTLGNNTINLKSDYLRAATLQFFNQSYLG